MLDCDLSLISARDKNAAKYIHMYSTRFCGCNPSRTLCPRDKRNNHTSALTAVITMEGHKSIRRTYLMATYRSMLYNHYIMIGGKQFWVHNNSTLLCSWHFSCYRAAIHWLVQGRMTSNNESVYHLIPWGRNIAKTMTSPGDSIEAGYWRPTAVFVVRNLPFIAGYFALIFTQTITNDKDDCYFLWLTQTPTSKHVGNPASQ